MKDGPCLGFDLFVVGAGPAGLTAAQHAASLGLNVGIADKSFLGANASQTGHPALGVALGDNAKRLIHFISQLGDLREDQRNCGFGDSTASPLNWKQLIQKVADIASSSRHKLHDSLTKKNIRAFAGKARLVKPHTLELTLEDGQKVSVTAKQILLASGSVPVRPAFAGAQEHVVEADEILLQNSLPQKVLVLGSNFQALELAGFLRGLGSNVKVLSEGAVEPSLDQEMISKLRDFLASFYQIDVVQGTPTSAKKEGQGTVVTWTSETGDELCDSFDLVVNEGARHVDVKSLGLTDVGVIVAENGKIKVDERFESSTKGVYAIGECVMPGPVFATIAAKQAVVLADGLAKHKWGKADPDRLPCFLYTPAEYGFIGLSEARAVELFGEADVDAFYSVFKPLEWNFNDRRKKMNCFTKVVHHNKKNQVLGIHYLGPNAAEVVQGFTVVVALGLGIEALQETVGIHPTTAEEVVNIKLNKRFDDPNEALEANC